LYQVLVEVFLSKTLDEWKTILKEIPFAPSQNIREAVDAPQAGANDFFVSYDHPNYGQIEAVANPVKLSQTPATIRMPAPEFAQHTEEVLLEYGYTWEEIVRFKEQRVIA
jgi:crotonobetainyl-CoA:carnitine CoA-transferase CaiB-like acyl-CoA transferase